MQILKRDLIRKSEESAVLNGAFSFRYLMCKAGTKAAEIICERLNVSGKKIAVLCGNGNNGGDGFVIADYLYGVGAEVTVVTPFGKPATENARYYYDKLQFVEKSDTFQQNKDFDVIIDALFGIGFNRAPSDDVTEFFEKVNKHTAVKVAVDIPSGVDCDTGAVYTTAIKADFTVTFIALKPCFVLPAGSDYCGEVIVADIGVKSMDYDFLTTEKPDFPKRRHNSHKGTYGTALMLCGSYGMAGAGILAAKAALRSGLGIAKCVVCQGIYSAFTASLPEAVCVPVKQTETGVLSSDAVNIPALSENCKAVLFGCGVGKGKDVEIILKKVLAENNLPTVIDADGINALKHSIELLRESKAPVIITPHPGEMARLCGISVDEVEKNRVDVATNFATENQCVVVLKGANTIIATPDGDIFFNMTGNPGMATGGSGDVLSGIMVSLLAQGFSVVNAAKTAVFLHGEAGDKAASKRGERQMIPSDIIEEL